MLLLYEILAAVLTGGFVIRYIGLLAVGRRFATAHDSRKSSGDRDGRRIGCGRRDRQRMGLCCDRAGAALGLITGFLIGDHFQELQKKRSDLDRRIQESERELQRLCDEVEKLKQEADEPQ